MYPKDIESGEQWRVRHQAPHDPDTEVVRVVTEVQARSIEARLAALNPVVEVRTITVSDWQDPDALVGEEPDDDGD